MCRLAAWIGPSIRVEDLILTPSHSLVEQSLAAVESKMAVNGDGYGFAWYANDGRLGIYRDVLPAWGDSNLASLGAMLESGLILAHVRASTYGAVARSNCHPFVSGRWSFMHNGQIADFVRCRRKLEALLPDELYEQRAGITDSELLFLLLLKYGLDKNVSGACAQVLDILNRATASTRQPNRITVVFSNGQQLFALRHATDGKCPGLYSKRSKNGGLVLASEPLDRDSAGWEAVAADSLLSVQLNNELEVGYQPLH